MKIKQDKIYTDKNNTNLLPSKVSRIQSNRYKWIMLSFHAIKTKN